MARDVGTDDAGVAPFGSDSAPGGAGVSDVQAMRLALDEARLAATHGDVPVGAVVVHQGAVVASAHNERERRSDPTAHAEILALRAAAESLGTWRLAGVTVVVTLEPCPMCAGALVAARVGRLVFGAADPRSGACGTLYNLCCDPRLNHEVDVVPGVLEAEAAALLLEFFAERRA
ncbi:MAG: tRNA adenosine(34) deaminase TadA [Acidimicrobiales bacterium]